MAAFENFTLYYAKSLTLNSASQADLKITNGVPADKIKLAYCIPKSFAKRVTDTSNALSLDPTKPDTGTAGAFVELSITQERDTTLDTNILETLLQMFYIKSSDDDFEKGRFGLLNDDNPELDVEPEALAGYKFVSFSQNPNPNDIALVTYTVTLDYVGDHTKLGAFQ